MPSSESTRRLAARLAGALAFLATIAPGQLWIPLRPVLLANLSGPGRYGEALAAGDFDGDGFADLAVGEPQAVGEDSEPNAGRVRISYGSPHGPDHDRVQIFDQGLVGVPGTEHAEERFGAALAAGRFDDDDYDDLAIGVEADEDADGERAGAVVVLYGGPAGLSTARAQRWSQDSPGIAGGAEAGDLFGGTLASGDFDADGVDDLAIGVPGENRILVPPFTAEGAVHALYGTEDGLSATGSDLWTVATFGNSGFLGAALAAARLDSDGYADLAVGGPLAGGIYRGTVYVLHGTATGVDAATLETVPGDQDGEGFGASLASGDWNADGYPDLAIGAPGYDLVDEADVGRVELWFGGAATLIPWLSRTSSDAGVPGSAEPGDRFGAALASCDFDHNGHDDLAIGVPQENWGATPDAGAVVVLYFDEDGIRPLADNQEISENHLYPDGSEEGDLFGFALACGDFDATGHADLAIGVPDQAGPLDDESGTVWTLFGALFADGFESGTTGVWSETQP